MTSAPSSFTCLVPSPGLARCHHSLRLDGQWMGVDDPFNTILLFLPIIIDRPTEGVRLDTLGIESRRRMEHHTATAKPIDETSNRKEKKDDPVDDNTAKQSNGSDGNPKEKQGNDTHVKTLQMPTPEQLMQEEFMNHCAVRSVMSLVMGGGMGVLMGLVFGTMDNDAHLTGEQGNKTKTAKQQILATAKSAGQKSWSYAKTFAAMGALYSGSECVIEKARAKHDIYNSAYAGCFTGGALAARAGWQAAGIGCASFAAFSVMIDKVLDH